MSQPQNCDTIRLLVPITIQPPARYLPSAPLSTAASNGLSGKLSEPQASFSRAVTYEARMTKRQDSRFERLLGRPLGRGAGRPELTR